MPVPTFDLDVEKCGCAANCEYGTAKVCYVLNNPNENYPSRKKLLERNWKLINSPAFVAVMTKQIRQQRINDFRWFGSGDVFDLESLEKIMQVCKNLPRVRFWFPTSRDGFLIQFLQKNKIPKNVTLRLSSPKIDHPIPDAMKEYFAPFGVVFSETTSDPAESNCSASVDGSNCGDCDHCWNPEHQITKYWIHGKKAQKNLMQFTERK